ncbi:phosphatase PAP2 family protein [Mucilaginibacter ginsenosidivorans]|uniref:Phosphatase PAP2 family protein n=1 Tax=Mucilaginibacter ginsenosidivorans TaxID=398053 RepID=A0A5B8V0L2_9SPHI|nr:phosphatase PAP2 family protein [Mucilaginibacter ginsenosidivorans]QEC65047.1 phosphatase PAP2 family protein [Mucilaginibacter ginsenosidivorans]
MEISLITVLRRIRWMVIPYLVILVICLVIKLTFTRSEIYFAVNGLNSPVADFLAPYITDIGNGWTAVATVLIMILFSYRKALILATAYTVTSLSAQIVKYIFDLPRPQLYFGDKLKHAHFVKGVYILSFNSFPSGHTVTAFTLAVLFSYWCRNKRWAIVFLLIAVLVGYSRMYLSEHFFEDVVAGSVIGFVLTVIWLRWLDNGGFIQKPGWQKGLLASLYK